MVPGPPLFLISLGYLIQIHDFKYHLKAGPELQIHESNWLRHISTWMSDRHLKLNMFTMLTKPDPSSNISHFKNWYHIKPVNQARNLGIILDSNSLPSPYLPISNPSASPIDSTLKLYLTSIHFSPPPLPPQSLIWTTVKSLQAVLPLSNLDLL